MAKDKSAGAMSEESIAFLEDVKKGKPRKFAMICKGTSVVSLVLYKKGNVEKRKKEAKEAGKGQFYFGVVDGKGISIRFVLARADGFDSPPVKTAVLKGFLDEEAEFKCKPLFEIVDAAPLVLDEGDPLVARFVQLQAAALAACDAHPKSAAQINLLCRQIGSHFDQDQADQATQLLLELEATLVGLSAPTSDPSRVSDSVAADGIPPLSEAADVSTAEKSPVASQADAEFTARFKALLPAIKAAPESVGEEVKQQARQAADFAKTQQDFTKANGLLDQIEALLRTSEPPAVSRDPGAEFKSRLQELLPAIQRAKAENSPAGQQIALLASEAATLARKQDFIGANQRLERVTSLLEQAARPGGDEASQFTARLKMLKPNIDQALKIDVPLSRELKMKVSEAAALARQREFTQALRILDDVEPLIRQVEASATGPAATSPTATGPKLESEDYLRLQLRWRDAQAAAAGHLTELGRLLLALPEVQEDSRLADVEQVTARLPGFLPKFGDVLTNYLQRASQGGPDAEQCRQDALRTVATHRQQLAGAPVLRQLAEFANKNLKAQLSSAGELEAALLEVETALTTAT